MSCELESILKGHVRRWTQGTISSQDLHELARSYLICERKNHKPDRHNEKSQHLTYMSRLRVVPELVSQ